MSHRMPSHSFPSTRGSKQLRVLSPHPGELPVHLHTVEEVRAEIADYRPPRELRRMAESVHRWRARYEEFLLLLAETREEGWPFQVYPPGWSERAARTVGLFHKELDDEELACHFPERSSSNLRQLAQTLKDAACDPGLLNGRRVGLARRILDDTERRWGAIGSDRRAAALAIRKEGAGGRFERGRELLLARLEALNPGQGIADLEAVLAPGDVPIPAPLAERARKAWLALPSQLINHGIIDSPLSLAKLSTRWAQAALEVGDARESLRALVALTWARFPYSATLNSQAWDTLLQACGSPIRLHPTPQEALYLAFATKKAARGTLYESYYALPSLTPDLDDEGLLELGRQRARRENSEPKRIEVEEELLLMTSAGLWPLWSELRPPIEPITCAELVWRAIGRELKVGAPRLYQRRQRHRRIAHMWQRLVFFLSLAEPAEVGVFVKGHRPGAPAPLDRALQSLSLTATPSSYVRAWLGPDDAPF